MLSLLHIENIAIIECADISFDKGFNVMTGETGAGKSIVIDAISAILGERAYRDMIRTGAEKASARAVFSDVPEYPWFADYGVPYDPETVIQREILPDGKNICKVNGTLVTVQILNRLGKQLIDIHGQHDSASLFNEANHLGFLDSFAENAGERECYLADYQHWAEIRREMDALTMDEGEKLRRMETLRYQIDEIEKADLKIGEDDALEERRKILQNAEKFSDALHSSSLFLNGDDETDGAVSLLTQAQREIAHLSRYGDSFQEIQEKLTDLMYQVQDVGEQLRDTEDSLEYSSDELERIEARLDVIHRLRRKYGATCEDILEYCRNAKEELDEIRFADDRLEELKQQQAAARKKAEESAERLRRGRISAGEELSRRIREELSQLDMPKVQFSCRFTEKELSPDGGDEVAFYLSANAGETLKPLSKVASGGELVRIMLAIKNVLAEKDSVATLIFDEVDTGVSGRAAQRVAEKLKSVSRNKQVLCVTHLPQIAALGDTHLFIEKQVRGGRTYTDVTPLDRQGRIRELARIIGGTNITEVTLKSAEEMIQDS